MGSAVLVKDEKEAAWEMLEGLRNAEFPMDAAFWQYLPDVESWRLFIATPLVGEQGPIAAYTRLQTELNRIPAVADGFSVTNISLISPASEQVARLRKTYGPVENHPARVRRVDLSPDEAYIYFLR